MNEIFGAGRVTQQRWVVSVRARLIACLALLAVALAVVTVEGWRALTVSHESISDIVEDQINHVDRLKRVSDMYAVNIVDTAHKVRSGALSWEQGSAGVQEALAIIRGEWAKVKSVELDEEERRLVIEADAAMRSAELPIRRFAQMLEAKDQSGLEVFVAGTLYPAVDPIGGPLSKLVDVQLSAARSNYEEAHDAFKSSRLTMLVVGLGSLVVLGVAIWIVLRGVADPLHRLQSAMTQLADGELKIEVPFTGRADEIGAMAVAVQVFKDNAVARRELEAEQTAQREARELRSGTIERIVGAFDGDVRHILASVRSASSELEATAGSLSSVADRGSASADDVSASSQAASANVKTVAAAAEELSASIGEISARSRMSAEVAAEAQAVACDAETTVEGLVSCAQSIEGVLEMISTIASQTNLLALNATIEAARAGEAGRGFAVVASEVKSLAGQTTRATDEIGGQIEAIRTASDRVAVAMRTIGEIVRRMSGFSSDIATAVEQQGAATQEIAETISDISRGNDRISASIEEVAQGVTDTSAGAKQVLASSCELSQGAATLTSKIDAFFSAIRAA